jgi:hypothetical protein
MGTARCRAHCPLPRLPLSKGEVRVGGKPRALRDARLRLAVSPRILAVAAVTGVAPRPAVELIIAVIAVQGWLVDSFLNEGG